MSQVDYDRLALGRRPRVAPFIAAAVAAVVLPLVVVAAISSPAETRVSRTPLLGKAAPKAGGSVIYGPQQNIDGLGGKWVVVNFFATWCVPCRTEHPELVRFALAHKEAGDATVLQVLYGDKPADARKFLDEHGGDWTVLDDPTGAIALDWGVRGLPESYLVDPGGIVVAKITGGATAEGLERLLRDRRNRA